MPPKKKKAGKGKKKKDTPVDQNKTTCNRFLKAYIKHCNEQSVLSCAAILQECRRCIEEDQLINKVCNLLEAFSYAESAFTFGGNS